MSLDKAIEHGKERRGPYRGSRAVDRSCRNHGSCPWCQRNRQHKHRKAEVSAGDDHMTTWTQDEAPESL